MDIGLIYIIVAEFFWALELILIRKFFPTQNSMFISGLTSVVATLLYLPMIFITREKVTPGSWLVIFVLGLTSFFLAQIFYVKGIQQGPSAFAIALTTLTMPLFAVVMGLVFFKEPVTMKIIIGSVLMIAGFLFISL